ncbi:DUF1642 domain-containing protein [Lapidilactobacillus dextrinicus]|uniref:DUF1642 domain-containing protein n=1 Tax=Lapidilactobacillus dextrinicus TaxID=51664 RepID=UPI003F27C0D9
MKEYKVGDTVYVKGKIERINNTDKGRAYNVNFEASTWFGTDSLVEPVKPVLPKNVADELEKAKNNILNFYGYLDSTLPLMNSFVFGHLSDRDARIKILSDAWYNGYTVEQEPRYKVYVTGTNKHYLYVKRGSWAKASNKKTTPITPQFINNYLATSSNHRDLYWFTDEEITKFNLQDCEKELVADD